MNADQGLSRIAGAYDTVAPEYAQAFRGEHARKPKDQEMLRRFARMIGARAPVWDLGCGPGQTARYLKDLGVDIGGLDLSGKLIEQARMACPDIVFRQGNILDLDFDDGSVAGVVAFYAIVHFTDKQVETAFREVYRVLQSDGLLLLTFHLGEGTIRIGEFLGKRVDLDFMFFTTGFITGSLRGCGFREIEVIERDPYPGVEYESRRAYVFATKPKPPRATGRRGSPAEGRARARCP